MTLLVPQSVKSPLGRVKLFENQASQYCIPSEKAAIAARGRPACERAKKARKSSRGTQKYKLNSSSFSCNLFPCFHQRESLLSNCSRKQFLWRRARSPFPFNGAQHFFSPSGRQRQHSVCWLHGIFLISQRLINLTEQAREKEQRAPAGPAIKSSRLFIYLSLNLQNGVIWFGQRRMMKRARASNFSTSCADEALQLYWLLGDLITRDYVISPNDFSSHFLTPTHCDLWHLSVWKGRLMRSRFRHFSAVLIDGPRQNFTLRPF